ncbi:MAG TPA: hypothetical protein VGD74_01135 [Vulgatibacter sp.]
MSMNVGELLVTASGDTRDAQQGLDAVAGQLVEVQKEAKETGTQLRVISGGLTEVGQRSAPSAAAGLDKVSDGSKRARGELRAVATAVAAVGGEAGGALGKVVSLGSMLGSSFAMGGAIGLGVGAVVSGVQMLATSMREAAAESRQLQALNDVLGVTERDVRNVERAFSMAGNELDRAVVQKLIATTREAGISTVEIAAMAGEIKRIQDLTGMDAAGAAAKIAAEKQKQAGDEYIKNLKETAKAREDQASGVSQWQREIEDGTKKDVAALDGVRVKLDEVTKTHARAVAQYGYESDAAQQALNEKRRLFDERDRLEKRLAEASALRARLTTQDEIDEGQKSADAFVADYTKRRAATEAEARRLAAERKQKATEEKRVAEEIETARRDAFHRTKILAAQAAEDKKAEIDALADYEIAKLDELAAKHVELEGRVAAQVDAINAKRATDKAKADSDAAKALAKQQKEAKDALDRTMKKADDAKEKAGVAGVQAGTAFIGGIKSAIQNDDPLAVFKGLLSGLGTIFSATGNPIAGAAMSGFGGLFHSGGMIGTGGQRIPRYHSGGMIVAHRGVMLPQPGPGEVPIMGQAGEGVLSRRGVAAAGGPQAVRAYNEGRPAPSGAISINNYQTVAFDPRSFERVTGRTVEPAQYRRGVSRADSKALAGMRRRVRPPRSGMLR